MGFGFFVFRVSLVDDVHCDCGSCDENPDPPNLLDAFCESKACKGNDFTVDVGNKLYGSDYSCYFGCNFGSLNFCGTCG